MFCYKCGYELKDGTNFCGQCGSKNKYTSLIPIKKDQTFEAATTSKVFNDKPTTSSELNTKQNKHKSLIILGVLILVLSIGFGSYYMSISKFFSTKSKNSKETSTENKVTTKNDTTDKDSTVKIDAVAPANETETTNDDSTGLYILPKSGSEKLLDSDLSILTKEDLTLARNEIYARHGLVFKGDTFKSYFSNKSWYTPNSNFKASDGELDNIELYNIQLISKYENK
jgi:uncharacterized Zn finger protein (UPF0148 family)